MNYKFNVVAFGSSAGGLEPLMEIISLLPVNANAAFVVVSHLFNGYKSYLDQIIARVTTVPVQWAGHEQQLQAGNIYLLPPGFWLTLENGRLLMEARLLEEIMNWAIDRFFVSVGRDVRAQAIGVVLSGCGEDGVKGAREIDANGGIVIVQDPHTAVFPFLPVAVIQGDHPDDVLTPAAIVDKILTRIPLRKT